MFKDIIRFLFFTLPRIVCYALELIIFNEVAISGYALEYVKRQNKKQIEQKVLMNYLKKCHKKEYKKDNGKTQGNG